MNDFSTRTLDRHEARLDKHDERLRSLENLAAKVGAYAAIGSLIGGGIVAFIVNVLSKH